MKKSFKGILAAAAVAVGMFAASASHANTIQPILQSVTPAGGGLFTYDYSLQLTPNNGLTSTLVNNGDFDSGVIMLDFLGLNSASLSFEAGDVTTVADWGLETPLTGGGSLQNSAYNSGVTTLVGSPPTSGVNPTVLGGDDNTILNIVAHYTNPNNFAPAGVQRHLIHLLVTTNIGTFDEIGTSLSRDTNVSVATGAVREPVETFNYDIPVVAGVPLPTTSIAGAGLIGLIAVSKLRRRSTVA